VSIHYYLLRYIFASSVHVFLCEHLYSTGLALVWQPSSEFGVPVLAYELQLRIANPGVAIIPSLTTVNDDTWIDAYYGTDISFTVI
jgi:hypothetical protein